MICGLVFVGVSIPLIIGKIPPNYYYGWKTRKALSNEETWYKMNKYFGKDFLVAGLVILAGSFVLLIFSNGLSASTILKVSLILLFVPAVATFFKGLWYQRKL